MAGETILLIDDNEVNRELVTDLLEAEGYEVAQAGSAEEGIEAARTKMPSLILMDIGLQGMDGFRATEILKQDEKTEHIPIVVVTAYAMREDEERAFRSGCSGFLTKPIDLDEFPVAVAGFISGARPPA